MSQTGPDLAHRFLQGVGIADVSLAFVEDKMPTYLAGYSAGFHLVAETADWQEALEYVSRLTFPESRHVAFEYASNSVFMHNSRNGSDYADYVVHVPRHLNCRFARVLNRQSKVWSNGNHRQVMGYETRIFDLHDRIGETIRTVYCANDGGRWGFHTSGVPHPVESEFPYEARRKPDRFAEVHLRKLADEFGLAIPSVEDFCEASRFLLFSQDRGKNIESCSIQEADDPAYRLYMSGLQFVNHMSTHASSVIVFFEKCLELNPDYEPRVREYLDQARISLDEDSH